MISIPKFKMISERIFVDPDGSIASYEWINGTKVIGTTATLTTDFNVASSPHTITLRVTDNGGATASDNIIITIEESQAPQPPNLSISGGEEEIILNWVDNNPSTIKYNVYRSTNSGEPYTLIATEISQTSYTDSGGEGTFYYVVKAVDAAGNESNFSNQVEAEMQD